MEAERHGHRHVGGRLDRGGDGERAAGERHLERDDVGEGEGPFQVVVRSKVEPRVQACAVFVRAPGRHLPLRPRVQQPVDGEAVRVLADQRGAGVELDAAARRLVGEAREPVGPRVEQRDPHGRARVRVLGQSAALRK